MSQDNQQPQDPSKPSDLNYETAQMTKRKEENATRKEDAAASKADSNANPPKKDDSTTNSSQEMMGEDIKEDGSMPRY